MAKSSDTSADWKTQAKKTLTVALDRLEDIARDSNDPKVLESIVKTVGDVVGAGEFLGRGKATATPSRDDSDED